VSRVVLDVDGARLFNAASSLNCELRELTTSVGVDILSLGGTKVRRRTVISLRDIVDLTQVGLMYGEAVLVFNPLLRKADVDTIDPLKYRHKQMMQLASKQRFIAAQFYALLNNDVWKKSTEHSNRMAQLFLKRLESITSENERPFIRITRPVQTNVIFAEIPHEWYEPLSAKFPFYKWRTKNCEVRLMCSFDTNEDDIERFVDNVKELMRA
jgi:threonine aldolase